VSGWFAKRTDDDRLNAIRLLRLTGERDQLAHQRDLLRADLAAALIAQDAHAYATVTRELNGVISAWKRIIEQIRELQAEKDRAA
jgi:hypothetical protein